MTGAAARPSAQASLPFASVVSTLATSADGANQPRPNDEVAWAE